MDQNLQNDSKLRQLILNTKEPLLIRNQIECDLTSWNLEKWKEVLDEELLQFRCGKYQFTEEPQWESTCVMKTAKFEDFINKINSNANEWWYFDYKYLSQWFTDKDSLTQKIDWSALGFSEVTSRDSTIWIGSKGAHTPCHVDTYGCNMILQVFGRKQWLLFPPKENLKPTRIPFEESSIYSKLNFFSPRKENFKEISHCHKVILNPGDVLVVPNRWWHYVENLETAISINAWLPLPQDEFQRIKESIATIFVRQVTQIQSECLDVVLNPNMLEEMVSSEEALNIITKIRKISGKALRQSEETFNSEQLLKQFGNISKIPVLSETEFSNFLNSQSERFERNARPDQSKNTACKHIIDFLEAVTDEEVLNLMAKKLIEMADT